MAPIDFTIQNALDLWNHQAPKRERMALRFAYYLGENKITAKKTTRRDNEPHNNAPASWVRYAVDIHTGFLTTTPWRFVAQGDNTEADSALEQIAALYDGQNLGAVDAELYEYAILAGYGVEVHSYDSEAKQIQVKAYRPTEWAFVEDEFEELQAAVHRVELPAFRVFEDILLEVPHLLWTVYDAASIRRYIQECGAPAMGTPIGTAAPPKLITDEAHEYKRVPVVRFKADQDGQPLITDAVLSQVDLWDKLINANADDIEQDVNAILALSGYDINAMSQQDVEGRTPQEKLKQDRILVLDVDGKAEMLTRNTTIDKFEFATQLSRSEIHRATSTPDMEMITGSTGDTSGISLKLRLRPMQQFATKASHYIKESLSKRVELFNVIFGARDSLELSEYNVLIEPSIPVNELEIITGLRTLVGPVVPMIDAETAAELNPAIDDPAQLIERLPLFWEQVKAFLAPAPAGGGVGGIGDPATDGIPEAAGRLGMATEDPEELRNIVAKDLQAVFEKHLESLGDALPRDAIKSFVNGKMGG